MEDKVVNLFGSQSSAPLPRRIDLARIGDIDLGPVTAIPSRRLIRGPMGEASLEPKVMQVLVALARPAGKIVSRDDLLECCWEGRIVGDASVNRVMSLLRSAFREVSGEGVSVETVPKVGYRLVADFSEVAPDDETPRSYREQRSANADRATRGTVFLAIPRGWIVAALLFVVIAIGTAVVLMSRNAAPSTRVHSIAVLGLATKGVDQPFFVQGFVSELRDQLARNDALDVRLSTKPSGQVVTLPAAIAQGKRLRVDYVWQGTLRQDGDRAVLSSSLIDVNAGSIAWSEDLSSSARTSVNLPIRTARSVFDALGLAVSEQAQSLSGSDYRQYLTALGLIRARDRQSLTTARTILLALTERHAEFAEGWGALAKSDLLLSSDGPPALRGDAARNAERALSLAPESTEALKVAGMLATDAAERVRLLRQAVNIDPGDGEGWLWLSHVAAHPDFPHEERRAIRRLSQIDPLWGLSWQASYLEVQQAGLSQGLALERELSASFPDRGTQAASAARIANLSGDLSLFHRLVLNSLPTLSRDQQSMMGMQLSNMRLLMGLPPFEPRESGMAAVMQQATGGRLPSRDRLTQAGVTPELFWEATPLVIAAPPQMLRQGRGRELIAYYDAVFASPAALEKFASERLRPHHFIPQVATYVGFAMQQEGREKEAQKLFDLAEKSIARWRANDFMWLTPLLFEANLAAARGQPARATAAVQEMLRFGYPYALLSPGVPLTGPLLDDPVWDDMRADPQLDILLRPIRQHVQREREEVLRQAA